MCLSTVTRSLSGELTYVAKIGFKVLERKCDAEGTLILAFPYREEHKVVVGEVMTANMIVLNADDEEQVYISGFHLFTNLDDARNWLRTRYWGVNGRIFQVEYDGVTAEGLQRGGLDAVEVVVARKMRILEEVTE